VLNIIHSTSRCSCV